MCLPAAIGLAGAVVSGIGAAQQMKAQEANANAQAGLLKRQQVLDRETSGYEAHRVQDKIDRTLGAQRAGFASSGIGLTGSAADILDETATEGALDIGAIRWNSKLRQDNLGYERKVAKMNANAFGRAAPLAFVAPVIGGAARFAGAYQDSGGFGG